VRAQEYFIQQLTGHGIKIAPMAFNNPRSHVTCVALKYRTEDELPQMYDKDLLRVFYEGSMDDVRRKVLGEKSSRVANAQNANGETVLMKVCRRALSGNGVAGVATKQAGGGLSVISLLLKSGANPMVCCDSGKNVLHDVFWTAKPPPAEVLEAMENMVAILRESTGKNGLLELMLSEDKHGYTPLDYVVPSQQPNWRKIVDTVVAWASEEASLSSPREAASSSASRLASPAGQPPAPDVVEPAPRPSCQLELETCDPNFASTIVDDMHDDDRRLVAQLCAKRSSFLISDIADPDAAIVAVSPAFARETGYEPDEVLGRNCRFLQGPGTSTEQVALIRRALATASSVNVSLLNYRKNGDTFINNFLLTPLRRADSTVAYFVGVQNCDADLAADRRRRLAGAAFLDDSDVPRRPLGAPPPRTLSLETTDLATAAAAPAPPDDATCDPAAPPAATPTPPKRASATPAADPASDTSRSPTTLVEPRIKKKRVSACAVS